MTGISPAVPSAVAPSAKNSVPVLTEAQLGPYQPMAGDQEVPQVGTHSDGDEPAQPGYGGYSGQGAPPDTGTGAPSVPDVALIYKAPPIDSHYLSEFEAKNPYSKVNNPPTRGMFTWVKTYLNHVFNGTQTVNEAGWQQNSPQQRNSVMRITPPPRGMGYDPETAAPVQLPQQPNTQKFLPATGTDPYGSGVLNSDTFGAGQTAGGVGGNTYTPSPGPPPTTQSSGYAAQDAGMPTWG